MKGTIAVFAVLSAAYITVTMAESPPQFTPEQRKRLIDINRRVYGGFVTKPDPGNGHISIVNLQRRVPEKALMQTVRSMRKFSSLPIEFMDKGDASAAITVYLRDDASQTAPLLVSPDEFWAQVNIAALAADKPQNAILIQRSQKALARALAYSCGACGSQYPNTLAGPIRSLKQLDSFPDDGMPPDVFMRMGVFAAGVGVRPVYRVSYAAACEEGWAPAPTNEYQKAIWDKVHEMPSAPIKIKPETKKVSD